VALTDEAIDRIKGMIVSGQLRPGDRLPKEADLAVRLGLSRSSLREAVRAAVAHPRPRRTAGRRHVRDQPAA
jgi:DNA-binding FadR family transcriptional regulator